MITSIITTITITLSISISITITIIIVITMFMFISITIMFTVMFTAPVTAKGPPCRGGGLALFGKGQMGSALMGSLQISSFLTEGLLGYSR